MKRDAIEFKMTGDAGTAMAEAAGRSDLAARDKILGRWPGVLRTYARAYFQLTKPWIMLLVLVTGISSMILEGSLLTRPGMIVLFAVALYLTGGAANAFNQYFERDRDALMRRTRGRRPLPMQRISPGAALVFSSVIGLIGISVFGLFFNVLTAAMSAGTILFYSLVYTLILKPRTVWNIVLGGMAGAMAPIGAWTAATGGISLMPVMLFLIIFIWTPPHFWSLALCFKDDYQKAGWPMLPVVKGDGRTLLEILIYTILLLPTGALPVLAGAGRLYLMAAIILGSVYIFLAGKAWRVGSPERCRGLFRYSLIYLFSLFGILLADRYFYPGP